MSWLLFGFKVHASRAVVGTQIKGKTADVIVEKEHWVHQKNLLLKENGGS